MTLALLIFLSCQDNEYVQKLDKVKYNLAAKICKESERKLDSEEAAAIERLTRIIDDPDLSKKECNLFIQQTDQYDPPYAFLPYQYRARARMSLAGKSASAAEKKRQLEEAVRDLEESVKRNVKSSASYLQTAQGELKRLAAVPVAPAPVEPSPSVAASLRNRLAPLMAENRFLSARLLVDREGAGLAPADRADFIAQEERACRNYLTEEMRLFRGRLQRIGSVAELRAMTKDEFEVTFDLPPAAEVSVAHPAYDWARRQAGIFQEVWSNRKPGSALLGAAEDAAHLEEGGENPWLKTSEGLAFQDLHSEVDRRIAELADAPKARRDLLAAEVRDRIATWNAFIERIGPDVRKRAPWIDDHSKSLRSLGDRQPRELAALDGEDLRGCFDRFPVEPELLAFEGKLRAFESGGGLARESRQALYSLLVATRSFRLFLEGKGDADVARAVRNDLESLGHVGGPVDPDRFGPRIRKVYDSLR
ncbi:MAG TPA: hypothetical protein VKW04_18970 [Planctomycetota bacterium]|nr:hypothetical protein [Planctomycetota bacterium]